MAMPTWEEWNTQLTEEQRKYSLYKILDTIERRSVDKDRACELCHIDLVGRIDQVNDRIDQVEKMVSRNKWISRGVGVFSGGVGGFFAVLFKDRFGG